MNLTFYKEPFEIPEEWKITLWRFNFDDSSPLSEQYAEPQKWERNAKAVSADIPGIFAMQEEQLSTGYARYALLGYAPVLGLFDSDSSKFLRIEADKRDILFVSTEEIAVSKANIIETLTRKQFGRLYPAFPHVTTMVSGVVPYYREVYSLMRDYFKDEEQAGKGVFSLPDGFPHSLRVDKGINLLCRKMGMSGSGVSTFAYWHDVMKSKDHDPDHGKRASEVIRHTEHLQFKYKNVDVDRLSFACEHHSTMLRSGDTLIDICFDADRLDLPYRGVKPDPSLMATEIGAYYAENYDEYMRDIMKTTVG